jgi:hypothetical protein
MSKFSLDIQYAGHRNSLYTLEAAGFTKLNFIPGTTVNSLLDATTPQGVLGGSVAGISGAYVCGAAAAAKAPLGIFINNAAGNPFENSPAIASGICPFMNGFGSYRVFVWETNTVAGAPQTYNPGDLLYASANGLLTKEANGGTGGNATLVAICTKPNTATDVSLGIELRM